jgi:hypothetical protein
MPIIWVMTKFLSQFEEKNEEEEQHVRDNEKIYKGIISYIPPKKQDVKKKGDQ